MRYYEYIVYSHCGCILITPVGHFLPPVDCHSKQEWRVRVPTEHVRDVLGDLYSSTR